MANVKQLVEEKLNANGFSIDADCCGRVISAEEIDQGKLIDTHYYAIASKATLKKPHELNVPADKFEKQFEKKWQDVLDAGLAFNAIDGAKELGGLDATGLEKLWRTAKTDKKMVKFGGGFYCAELQGKYVFNGFFMSMREGYVAEGKKIIGYSVSWDQNDLSWEDFRQKILGP